jgi:ankyrin repeat protein
LIAAGADANAATTTGASALMWRGRAARYGDAPDRGRRHRRKETAHGQTALMVAAGLNRVDVVKLLLERGADATLASKVVDLNALTAEVDADPVNGQIVQRGPTPVASAGGFPG